MSASILPNVSSLRESDLYPRHQRQVINWIDDFFSPLETNHRQLQSLLAFKFFLSIFILFFGLFLHVIWRIVTVGQSIHRKLNLKELLMTSNAPKKNKLEFGKF